jgi:hypothetical protein
MYARRFIGTAGILVGWGERSQLLGSRVAQELKMQSRKLTTNPADLEKQIHWPFQM